MGQREWDMGRGKGQGEGTSGGEWDQGEWTRIKGGRGKRMRREGDKEMGWDRAREQGEGKGFGECVAGD